MAVASVADVGIDGIACTAWGECDRSCRHTDAGTCAPIVVASEELTRGKVAEIEGARPHFRAKGIALVICVTGRRTDHQIEGALDDLQVRVFIQSLECDVGQFSCNCLTSTDGIRSVGKR